MFDNPWTWMWLMGIHGIGLNVMNFKSGTEDD